MADLRLYAVKDKQTDEIRLVDASSQAAARTHVVSGRYETWLPTGRETAQIMSLGVKPETAGVPVEQAELDSESE